VQSCCTGDALVCRKKECLSGMADKEWLLRSDSSHLRRTGSNTVLFIYRILVRIDSNRPKHV